MRGCSLDAAGPRQELVAGICEKCIEHRGFHKMESDSVSVELLDLCKGF